MASSWVNWKRKWYNKGEENCAPGSPIKHVIQEYKIFGDYQNRYSLMRVFRGKQLSLAIQSLNEGKERTHCDRIYILNSPNATNSKSIHVSYALNDKPMSIDSNHRDLVIIINWDRWCLRQGKWNWMTLELRLKRFWKKVERLRWSANPVEDERKWKWN